VTGDGIGGPNGEFALAAAMAIPDGAVLGAVDTDGGDGSTDAAGALVDARTVEDPEAARAALSNNDSYSFLESREGLLRTGATGTNVNDLRVLVIPE
jgi:hydroxypyruvate reductase